MSAQPEAQPYYKFRSYGKPDSDERRWVRDTLFDNWIRFSTIADLNDPFEGKPCMIAAHDPEQQREAVRGLMIREWMAVHNVDRATALQNIEQRYLSAADGFNAETFQAKLEEIINRMFWIYCVAGTRAPILMWSHYADGHKGLALHFRRDVMPFAGALTAIYPDSDEYPQFRYPVTDQNVGSVANAAIKTKSKCWLYEDEYRVVRNRTDTNQIDGRWRRDFGLKWNDQLVQVPDTALCGVTLGAGMDAATAKDLTKELAEKRPQIEVWRARRNRTKYELIFDQVR
jgi:hypothetical protein